MEERKEISREKKKKILIFSLKAGEIMMKNGAEIYRVEDTISRVCKACGIPYAESFVTTTGIFISLDDGHEETEIYTYHKRIRGGTTNLDKISKINQLSRDLVNTDLTLEEGMKRLKAIDDEKPYNPYIQAIGAAMTASFFAIMFGGSIKDFVCTFIIGFISFFTSIIFDKINSNYFVKGFCCTALATFLTLCAVLLRIGENMDAMIIGTLMIFVPGVAITNAIRDFLTGDTLAGLSRAIEAFFIAVSLAVGAGVVLRMWIIWGGIM